MLSKNKRPYDPEELPRGQRRLRANVRDMAASNMVSASRMQEFINDMADAGLGEFTSMRGDATKKGGNTAKKLRRGLLKDCQWPDLYYAEIRVLNKKTHKEEKQWCAFLLPHEYIEVLRKFGDLGLLMDTAGLDPKSKEHLEFCEMMAQCPLLPLGLWGDGVPVNWDRTESVDTISINLPGQVGKFKPLRLPVVGLSHKQLSENTYDDIMEVVAWSFQSCAEGVSAVERHDHRDWLESDKTRAKKAGTDLGIRAALCEVRGDWKFFGEVFSFPKHNTKAGCCWKCRITPEEVI